MPTPPTPVEITSIHPKLVPISKSYAVPERFSATFTPAELDLPICRLDLVVERSRVICQGLHVERRPGARKLTGQSLRDVPVGGYISQAADAVGHWIVTGSGAATVTIDGKEYPVRSALIDDDHIGVRTDGMMRTTEGRAAVRAPRVQGSVTEKKLREVADVYRAAHARNHSPAQAVMQKWRVTRTTASRWIRRAREAGFLGEARPRTAGEWPEGRPALDLQGD